MLYDRPVSELMHDAVAALTPPYTVGDITSWFQEHYPKVKPRTVRAHVIGMTSNHTSRHFYPTLASRSPLFHQMGPGLLEPFDPDQHLGDEARAEPLDEDDSLSTEEEPVDVEAAEFVLESQLEAFLAGNWSRLDWGRPLAIWRGPAGEVGHQLATPVGRLDFLCLDTSANSLVVVELKRGRPSDRVVGQLARYIGWVRNHLAAPGQQVEGLVVSHDVDDTLRYAISALPSCRLLVYEVNFELRQVEKIAATAMEGGASRDEAPELGR